MTKATAGMRQRAEAHWLGEPRPLAEGGEAVPPRLPRLVLAGEANSGKTTLVNFLLEAELLVADIFPNTACPTLLRFGEAAHLRIHRLDGTVAIRSLAELHRLRRDRVAFVEVFLPTPVLRSMEILDLPGFGSAEDAAVYGHWLAGADIQIWCTPATQAWKASEKAIWQALGGSAARSILVVTHRDLLSDEQLAEVAARMERETGRFFGHWTATATPEAIAARNPRGEIVRQDSWTSAGVEDFVRKLKDLLQGVAASRPATPEPEAEAAAPSPEPRGADLPDPLSAFALLHHSILAVIGRATRVEERAALIAQELHSFADLTLGPWLARNGRPTQEASSIKSLILASESEIMACLVARPDDPTPFTPAKILRQLEAELSESLIER